MGWQLVVLAACLFLLLLAESLGQLFLQNFICEQFLFIFGCPAVQLLKKAGGAVGEVWGRGAQQVLQSWGPQRMPLSNMYV